MEYCQSVGSVEFFGAGRVGGYPGDAFPSIILEYGEESEPFHIVDKLNAQSVRIMAAHKSVDLHFDSAVGGGNDNFNVALGINGYVNACFYEDTVDADVFHRGFQDRSQLIELQQNLTFEWYAEPPALIVSGCHFSIVVPDFRISANLNKKY
jgi:hypothetical protein